MGDRERGKKQHPLKIAKKGSKQGKRSYGTPRVPLLRVRNEGQNLRKKSRRELREGKLKAIKRGKVRKRAYLGTNKVENRKRILCSELLRENGGAGSEKF